MTWKTTGNKEVKTNDTKTNVQEDMVNHPPHYKVGGIETLDFIRAKLGVDGYVGYCVGNVLKYLSRAGHKDRKKVQEDLKKAEFYLKEAILIGEKDDG